MAISGTYDPADGAAVNLAEVGVDIAASGTFVAIESWATTATITGGDVPSNTYYTLDGTATTITGNQNPFVFTVSGVFTQGTTDPFKNLVDLHVSPTANKAVEVEISEDGSTTGSLVFTSSGGKITSMTFPEYDSNTTGLKMFSFVVTAPTLTVTVSS